MKTLLAPEKYFYAHDGKVFTSLEDLFTGIADMSEETFTYHLNKEKNDFYNWIYFVFGKESLAKSIQKVKTKSGFAKRLKDYVKSV